MQTAPQITFHGLEPSDALRELIEERMTMLERQHPRVTTCRVTVERPHHRHVKGDHWQVKVLVAVPGDEIVITREREIGERHTDPSAAVRDAFDAARRRLQDHARKVSGRTKHHEEPPYGHVLAMGADHGFLETDDGRQLYFHENAVLDGQFETLAVGAVVSFVEEDGVEGPQASTVRLRP